MLADRLLARWEAELATPVSGFDFSALAGRVTEDSPPWDYEQVCRAQLAHSAHVVDLGTGGGEALLAMADALPPDTSATEGWPPNVAVARHALEPRRIPVLDWDCDRVPSAAMPVEAGRFDLVLHRHESHAVAEVVRVLAPGGGFLTQQVGSDDAREAAEWFGPVSARRGDWSLDDALAELDGSGLEVDRAQEWRGDYRFADVAALMRYFAVVPWDLPEGFTVRDHADVLLRMESAPAG